MKSGNRRLLKLATAGVGAAAALTAAVVVEGLVVKARRSGASGAEKLGELHSEPVTVTTEDGVELHAEVDEIAPYGEGAAPRKLRLFSRRPAPPPATLVFVHGYALNLECWHFQREFFRGKRRMVFYDLRSHGESGRSSKENATIDQLGSDLKLVLDQLVPEGPVVLVGHSMGGMTIMALAEQHPEMFGDRITGTALISTTAGGMRTHRIISPLFPDAVAGQVTPRLLAALSRAPDIVDGARRRGSNVGFLVTDRFAFGTQVPSSYVDFVDSMLAKTPFEVLAEFFPNFDALDKFSVLHAFEKVPTLIVGGTKDLITSIGHSRKMASRIPGATLVECPGAGHMVILESADKVNAALADMIELADEQDAEGVS